MDRNREREEEKEEEEVRGGRMRAKSKANAVNVSTDETGVKDIVWCRTWPCLKRGTLPMVSGWRSLLPDWNVCLGKKLATLKKNKLCDLGWGLWVKGYQSTWSNHQLIMSVY